MCPYFRLTCVPGHITVRYVRIFEYSEVAQGFGGRREQAGFGQAGRGNSYPIQVILQQSGVSVVTGIDTSNKVTASWIHEYGAINDILIDYARLNDVTAFSRPEIEENIIHRGVLGDTLQSVMLEAGRPMLVVPPQWQARKCEHAVIGWNHSQEASRALSMTIPWLLEMKKVTIAVSKRREDKGVRLMQYLSWHGIESEIEILNRKTQSAGERLLGVCDEVGGDFLVVGGFSTARAKERLFGGVTNYLLSSSDVITAIVH